MEEKEIWKDIEGYEGLYKVSNRGRVRSLERTARYGRGYRTVPEKILKARKNNNGYLYVKLCKDGKGKMYTVHKLVATAFCDNPHGFKEVNHIDENKSNNVVSNLEWCSRSYNNTYNDRAKKVGKKNTNHPKESKPVLAIYKINGLILEFPSIMEAARQTGIDPGNITKCCKGKYKSIGGFYWMYKNNNDDTE